VLSFNLDALINSKSEKVASFLKNWIIDVKTDDVFGVVLGHCVFYRHGKVCGKLFKSTLRNLSGEKIAILKSGGDPSKEPNLPELMNHAWEIISNIEDHTCPSVDEKEVWSTVSFQRFLHLDKRKLSHRAYPPYRLGYYHQIHLKNSLFNDPRRSFPVAYYLIM
jgi:hypothetical protein